MANFSGRLKNGSENLRYLKNAAAQALSDPVDTTSLSYAKDLSNGTGANQANIYYREERPITSGGSFVLDLNGTSVQDIFGQNLAMTGLVDIMVINAPADESAAANTTAVTITTTLAGIFSGTTPGVVMAPGECFRRSNVGTAGLCTVTPTSADTITFTNASGALAKVQISAVGRG